MHNSVDLETMRAFITGGTGFIGTHVVRKLLERGYEVVGLARSDNTAAALQTAGAKPVKGDIMDPASMRAAIRNADIVFHLAASVQAGGTENVLTLANELGVPKIVYVSTLAIFGDTSGKRVDEQYQRQGPFFTEYDRTKWVAYSQVALPLIERGAPIVIAIPGGVYGPGDPGPMANIMRLFCKGIPILPGPKTTITYAHVEDIAEGIILTAECGKIGERYILTGPAIPLDEMFALWSKLTGRPAPRLHIPARYVRPVAALISTLPLSPLSSKEIIGILGETFMARADKAREELGWQTRPLPQGMRETFAWIASTPRLDTPGRKTWGWAVLSLLALAILIAVWLLSRSCARGLAPD